MKNYFLIFFLFCLSYSGLSQKSSYAEDDFERHEIKINTLYFVLEAVELCYEGNLSKNTSLGVSMFIPFNSIESPVSIKYNYGFTVNPYFRYFFGKKPAQGFFIEANAAMSSLEVNNYYSIYNPNGFYNSNTAKEKEFGFGLGAAVGSKFVIDDQIVIDVYAGLGKYLTQDGLGYPRLGINVGYRFY